MTEENKPLEYKLNEMLGDAFDKANAIEEDIEEKEEVEEGAVEEKQEHKKEDLKEKIRDEKGKFKAEKKAKKELAAEDAPKEDTDLSVSEPEVVAPVSKAPDHWSAGAKAVWDKLDPVVRAEALKQVEFANKLQSRHAQERKKYEAIDAVLEPQRNLLRANYGDEAKGLQQLFALSDFASKDPRGFVQWFAQQRGIDLRGLNQQPQQAVDPTINALQQQIAQLTQHISGYEQNQKQAVMSEVERTYQDFANNPANKYLEDVKDDMAFFLENGKAKDWQTAYNMAVKINPTVSEMIEAERLQEAQDKKRKEAELAANKAKKAQSLNVRSNGVVSSSGGSSGSWTDTLNATADRLMNV